MLWKGRRGSDNVEDQRGMSRGKVTIGGGIIGIIIAIIIMFFEGDPSAILNNLQTGQDQNTEQVATNPQEDEMAKFVSVVLADTEEIWTKLLEQEGKTYRKPKLVLFRDAVVSACGNATASTGPFYCSGDEKIYIDLSFCDVLEKRFGVHGDFAIAYVIAHEVGHHIQKQDGTLSQVHSKMEALSETKANALNVKLELQADFYAGLWAHYAETFLKTLEKGDIEEAMNAASAIGDDAIQMKNEGTVSPDDFTHGTSAQRKYWFKKGYTSGNISEGNTFKTEI